MTHDGQILAQRLAIASAAVSRLYSERPDLVERYGEGGRAKCVEDMEYTVQHLADAIWAGQPRLFHEYLAWTKAMLLARNVRADDLLCAVIKLGEVVPEHLPGPSAAVARAYVDTAVEAFPSMHSCRVEADEQEAARLPAKAREYLDALLEENRTRADLLLLRAVASGMRLRDLYVGIFVPVQREVGRLWQTGRITVAREHACTRAISELMGRLAVDVLFRDRPRNGLRLLAASVGGELHDLGIRSVADLFEAEGWTTLSCGANTPAADLAAEVRRFRPHVVALSATMTFHLRRVAQAISAIHNVEFDEPAFTRPGATSGTALRRPFIMVGGNAIAGCPELCRRVGADEAPVDAGAALDVLSGFDWSGMSARRASTVAQGTLNDPS